MKCECYKTVLILETPFWVAGAAESMKIGGWGCETERSGDPHREYRFVQSVSRA